MRSAVSCAVSQYGIAMKNYLFKKLFLFVLLILSFGAHSATGDFVIIDSYGVPVGSPDDQVIASISYPGNGSTVSSPTPFLGTLWTAHNITTYQNGTYTVDTVEGGTYTFTVGVNQIGVHLLFNWGVNQNIDVINVWDVTDDGFGILTYTSTDWDGDGIAGAPMIDGPFTGFSVNFNLNGSDLPPAVNVPQITVNGDAEISLQVGDSYIDAGATATDAEDGDLTASIIVSNSVDTSIVGIYTVAYSATDSDGNTSYAERTVIVTQGNFPSISLIGSSSVNVLRDNAYIESGATASDIEDGDITASIVITGVVDTSVLGSYQVNYSVTDSDGNTSSVARTVNVMTGDIPVITLLGPSSVTVVQGDIYSDAGAMAGDTEDGDLTSDIITTNPVNTAVAGSYTVTYNVTDSNRNAAIEAVRNVEVIDPSIVNGVFKIFDQSGVLVAAPDTAVTASIVYPGSGSTISSPTPFFAILWSAHDITTYQNGTYTIDTVEGGTYTFTVGIGQIGVHMLIDWAATTDIDVVNVWNVSDVGGIPAYTSIDWDGDGVPGAAMIDGPFVGFSANFDLAGPALPPVNNIPVIELNGESEVNLQVGDSYSEAGAIAVDAEDGDISASIGITNSVDTMLVGTYTVTYSVTDSDGNVASISRTVIVAQGEFPVISLNGSNPVNAYIGEAYLDAGATASDAEDGDISANIVFDSTAVNTSFAGSYNVLFSVTDSDGNTSTASRVVNVITGDIPVLSLTGSSSLVLHTGETYIEQGATAFDTEDGDITSNVVITGSVNTSVTGTYTIDYDVSDSNGNAAATLTRTITVIVADGNAEMCMYDPVGNIVGCDATVQADIVFPGSGSDIYSPTTFFGYLWTAHDITTYTEGSYSIDTIEGGIYNFTVGPDQLGAHILLDWGATTDIDVVLVWDVIDNGDGSLTLISTDWDGDGVAGAPMIDGPFFGFNANFDIESVSAALPLDNSPPEITLNGDYTVITYLGSTFYDPGATAYDNEDGDITGWMSISGTVNTSLEGTYFITYTVSDSEYYEVSALRTVIVVQPDADGDGVLYLDDNCIDIVNADQRDTDADGYGNVCDADLNNDNVVNSIDLGIFRQRFFSSDADADLNGDGLVNAVDLGMFKAMYGEQPGPSGYH